MKDLTPQLLRSLKHYSRQAFIKDVTAGVIVAIIALPLLLIVFGTLIPMWVSVPGVVSLCQFFCCYHNLVCSMA